MPSLERRRLWADLMFCLKFVKNFTNLEPDAFGLNRASGLTNGTTRGHPYKLIRDHNRINVQKYVFQIELSTHGILFLLVVFVVTL